MRKIRLGRRIARAIDLPEEALSDEPCVKINGPDYAVIYRHCGIYECIPERIFMWTRLGDICVNGSNLKILSITDDMAHISGLISSVELNYTGTKG